MNELRESRIEILKGCMRKLLEISEYYTAASPGWTLTQNAFNHINSLYHLEGEARFDEETLGVRFMIKENENVES